MAKYDVQIFETMLQKWIPHHRQKGFSTVDEAKKAMKKLNKSMERANIKAERDLRPESYGSYQIPLMRVRKR